MSLDKDLLMIQYIYISEAFQKYVPPLWISMPRRADPKNLDRSGIYLHWSESEGLYNVTESPGHLKWVEFVAELEEEALKALEDPAYGNPYTHATRDTARVRRAILTQHVPMAWIGPLLKEPPEILYKGRALEDKYNEVHDRVIPYGAKR